MCLQGYNKRPILLVLFVGGPVCLSRSVGLAVSMCDPTYPLWAPQLLVSEGLEL